MRAIWPLFVAGCTLGAEVVVPTPPIDESTASLVIVFEGETTFLWGIDLQRSPPPVEKLAIQWNSIDYSAVAFSFDRPLAFYGLTAGRIPIVGGVRSCGLNAPRAAAVFDSSEGTWRPVDPKSQPALALLADEVNQGCSPVDLCRTFTVEMTLLPTTAHVSIALPLDDQTALLSVIGERFFEVSRESVVERPDLFGLPGDAGAIGKNGEIWLGGLNRVARGTRYGGFVEEPIGGLYERIGGFAMRGEGAELEVLAVGVAREPGTQTATVVLHRFFAGSWSPIHQRLEPKASVENTEALWIENQALIVFGGHRTLLWDGTTVTAFSIDSPLPLFETSTNSLAILGELVVLAVDDGFLHRSDGTFTSWWPISEAALSNRIDVVVPVFEGFLFGGPNGLVNQFYPGSVVCGAQHPVVADIRHLVSLGDDILVAGTNPRPLEPSPITWLSAGGPD